MPKIFKEPYPTPVTPEKYGNFFLKKKNTGQLFFHQESIYEISKP